MFIEVKNISKKYKCKNGNLSVFDNLSLGVKSGEFIALTGKSGCGKSTLLKILGCLDGFSGGDFFFEGIDILKCKNNTLSEIRNKKIGFVYQNFSLIPEFTAFENIELPLGYGGIKAKNRKSRIYELLEKVGLADKADSFPNQLSGGQQQRIAIARALANSPHLILADEPTGNLDAENTDKIMSIFKEINAEGKTIIMVTHDEKAANYANKSIGFSELCKS